MEENKMNRLNELFEKMVSQRASSKECSELKLLYTQFIDDGREENKVQRVFPTSLQKIPMHY